MDFPFGDQVTVITVTPGGTKDEYGNPIPAETTSGPFLGAFDPAIGFESSDGRDQVASQPQVYLPYGVVVTSTSVLVINGKRYEVDGRPGPWRNPFTGWEAGVQVPLKESSG